MRLSDLFVVRKQIAADRSLAEGEKTTAVTGSFLTPQALMSFPVASALATGLWRLAGMLEASWEGSVPVVIVIGLLLGLIVWAITISAEDVELDAMGKLSGCLVALLNGLCLAMSALGIDIAFLGGAETGGGGG